MRTSTVILAGLLPVLFVLLSFETQQANAQLCGHCTCSPKYSPVCGKKKVTGELKVFPSRCVLNCTNECKDDAYVFLYRGKCKKPARPNENDTLPKGETVTSRSGSAKYKVPDFSVN